LPRPAPLTCRALEPAFPQMQAACDVWLAGRAAVPLPPRPVNLAAGPGGAALSQAAKASA